MNNLYHELIDKIISNSYNYKIKKDYILKHKLDEDIINNFKDLAQDYYNNLKTNNKDLYSTIYGYFCEYIFKELFDVKESNQREFDFYLDDYKIEIKSTNYFITSDKLYQVNKVDYFILVNIKQGYYFVEDIMKNKYKDTDIKELFRIFNSNKLYKYSKRNKAVMNLKYFTSQGEDLCLEKYLKR